MARRPTGRGGAGKCGGTRKYDGNGPRTAAQRRAKGKSKR